MSLFLLEPATDQADHARTQTLTVGISGDELLKNKEYGDLLENWNERQHNISAFVLAITNFHGPGQAPPTVQSTMIDGHTRRVETKFESGFMLDCVEISDPFGPTATDPSLTALVISQETWRGGVAVNEKRKEKGWTALDVYTVEVLSLEDDMKNGIPVVAKNFAAKISSTEIRRHLDQKRLRTNATASS
ncbi:MAG: hypothetical protein M1826_000062 [Phylliscum demangeonii]|nr:MAG: hypothetical protein M1826_000062 [Phylliscum demangeonii]